MAKPKQNWEIAIVVSCVVSIPATANTSATISKNETAAGQTLEIDEFWNQITSEITGRSSCANH
ncbi:MAG: hypothetical protein AAGB19_20305 [Cyanobacteria bacterium P01_F01_bin.3]